MELEGGENIPFPENLKLANKLFCMVWNNELTATQHNLPFNTAYLLDICFRIHYEVLYGEKTECAGKLWKATCVWVPVDVHAKLA